MRTLTGWTIVLLLLLCQGAGAEEAQNSSVSLEKVKSTIQWHFLPSKYRLFAPLISDLRESRNSTHVVNSFETPGDGPARVWGNIGTAIPFLESHVFKGDEELYSIQLLGEANALLLMRLRPKGGFSMDSADGKFGGILAFRYQKLSSRLGMSHWSAHLGDDYINQFNFPKRGFSREYVTWLLSYEFPLARPYGGIHYILTHRHPIVYKGRDFFNFQGGVEISTPPVIGNSFLFLASDFQSQEEHDYFINQSFKLGIGWKGETPDPLRVSLLFFRGFDPRGEFFDHKINMWGIGIDYGH